MIRRLLIEDSTDVNLERIQPTEARTLFNSGATVYLLPNKIKLNNQFIKPVPINQETIQGKNFDKLVEIYKYFVFNNNEYIGNVVWYYKVV